MILKQLKKFEYFYHCVFQGLVKKNKFLGKKHVFIVNHQIYLKTKILEHFGIKLAFGTKWVEVVGTLEKSISIDTARSWDPENLGSHKK